MTDTTKTMAQTILLDRHVGVYGFGLMGLTWRPNPCPQSQAFEAMRESLRLGANFWNGGEFYGPKERNSLVLLNEYFQEYPEDQDKVFLSVKGGLQMPTLRPDGSEKGIRRSVDDSLAQLQSHGVTKTIDLFECARVDPKTPIEDTIKCLAQLVKEGKIGGISLSEVSADSIRRAASIHPIAGVEVEFSLWAPENLFNGVIPACGELGIPVIAYSPLGRGQLSGKSIARNADIPEGDMRKQYPKYQDNVLENNNKLVHAVQEFAKRKNCSLTQVALAWVRGYSGRTVEDPTQGDKKVKLADVIPIPGSTLAERVQENHRPDIVLSESEMTELNDFVANFKILGNRYPEGLHQLSEG